MKKRLKKRAQWCAQFQICGLAGNVSRRAIHSRSGGPVKEHIHVDRMTDMKGQSTLLASRKEVGCLIEWEHKKAHESYV